MATTGTAFAIALAIYLGTALAILLAFSVWRRAPWTKHYYEPKRFAEGQPKPRRIQGHSPLAWITATLRAPEAEVVRCAGVDALMYLKILRFGAQLFLGISCLVLPIILPINLTGAQVNRLMVLQNAPAPASRFTYWLPSPAASIQQQHNKTGNAAGFSVEASQPKVVKPPDFYEDNLPPPPAGLEWWEYRPDVPLLPPPAEVLGPEYARYGWRYDAQYQEVQYRFSDLDKTTMANIEAGSSRLYAHALLAWAVSLYVLRLLHRYNQEAVRLRIHYLLHSPRGAQSHTVLLTDIPGVVYGTMAHRTDATLLRFLPRGIKSRLAGAAVQGVRGVGSHLKLGASWVADTAARVAVVAVGKGGSSAPVAGAAAVGSDPIGGKWAAAEAAASRDPAEGNARGMGSRDGSDGSSDFVIGAGRSEAVEAAGGEQEGAGVPEVWVAEGAWEQVLRQLSSGASIQQVVDEQMQAVYGTQFDHAFLVRDTSALDPLVTQYRALLQAATDLMDHYQGQRGRGNTIKPQKVTVVGVRFGAWGLQQYGPKPVRVEALQHYRDRLVQLWALIQREQESALQRVTPSAFVTFKTRKAQVIAAHSLMHRDMTAWRCHPAPGPDEVVWGNLGWRMWERSARRVLMWAAFLALALFYFIPSLLALNSLTSWLESHAVLNSLLTAVLPGLALKVFLLLLPWTLQLMNRFAGAVREADVDLGVVTKFFIFQVITVFFGSFIAGSFANQIRQFAKQPGSILTVLGTAAPQTAIFFLTYLMLQALLTKPLSLLRLLGLVMYWVRSRLAPTERAKARVWQDQTVSYGTLIPDDTIAVLLGLVFCLICPLVAPMALAYFLVVQVVWRFQLLYVYGQQYQSGGQAWTRVFDQVCFSLALFQLVMVGILGIKRTVAPPLIVLPLLGVTAVFWWSCHALFWRAQQTLALSDAASLDAQEQQVQQQQEGAQHSGSQSVAGTVARQQGHEPVGAAPSAAEVSQLYLSPSLKLGAAELETFLSEANPLLALLAQHEHSAQQPQADYARAATTFNDGYATADEGASREPSTAFSAAPNATASLATTEAEAPASGSVSQPVAAAGGSVFMLYNQAVGAPRGSLSSSSGRRAGSSSLDVELGVRSRRHSQAMS